MQDPTTGMLEEFAAGLTDVSVDDIAMQAESAAESEDDEISEQAAARPKVTPAPIPGPIPGPIVPKKRPVSGRYRGTMGSFELELRVDVDRTRPMKKLSGDFYTISGSTKTYFGSFIVDSPTINATSSTVTCRGLGRFTWSASAPVVQVKIPRRSILQPQAAATLQFFTTTNQPGAQYTCAFESLYFRTVMLETDSVSDVTTPVFNTYNTGLLPAGGTARDLTVPTAFGEAGVQMIPTAGSNVVPLPEAVNGIWSNSEMHASMVKHFTVFQNQPNWAVWLLVAEKHDLGSGLLGIMFDQLGPQRQGCAVFHQGIGGTNNQSLRLQLQTYVHELGHCFNLLHSWQKSLATPPGIDRPNSLSYMNYPWGFPAGEAAFWASFPFQFDDEEVVHLRHAFRNDIVMGGNPFATGSGLIDPNAMADPIAEDSGLKLQIEPVHRSFALGEPVVLKLQLEGTRTTSTRAHPYLHPNLQMTTVVISRPNGQTVKYEPFIDHLMNGSFQAVNATAAPLTDSAYIGFGKGGFYFDQPGNYKIRAMYQAADGSRIMSNVTELRVRYPTNSADEEIADLLIGEEQGILFYLLGSDSEQLSKGRDALRTVLDKYGDRPVADYVRLAMGVNAAREFKTVADASMKVTIRPADTEEAASLLKEAVREDSPVDNLTKVQVLEKLAAAQVQVGDRDGSTETASLIASIEPTAARAARA